ncbi:MAG: hypothetical protein CW348_01885 [Thermobifida sp.]|nr:hypothetical protein [Thermobifida sp.]PZN63265.1 MAG: hypothetical protein DIU53_08595 [Thermobifida fusca]
MGGAAGRVQSSSSSPSSSSSSSSSSSVTAGGGATTSSLVASTDCGGDGSGAGETLREGADSPTTTWPGGCGGGSALDLSHSKAAITAHTTMKEKHARRTPRYMAFMSAYRGAHALNHHETEMRLFSSSQVRTGLRGLSPGCGRL